MPGWTASGKPYTTIPDGTIGVILVEVKRGRYIPYSPQLQAQVSIGVQNGAQPILIVRPGATVSGPTIAAYGHRPQPGQNQNITILVFDPATGALSPYK